MILGGPHQIDEKLYRSDPGVNISFLKNMRHSAAKARLRADRPMNPSPAMKLGTAIHCAILEPDRFIEQYTIRPDVNARTKAGKEALAAINGEILNKSDFEACLSIAARLREDPFYKKFVDGGIYESSWFAQHELDVRLKARLDIWLPHMNLIVDVKTTDCIDERQLRNDIIDYHYHSQAAYYCDIVERVTGKAPAGYVILAIETKDDRDMRAFWLDDAFIAKGRADYREWLSKWYICEKTGTWPGYEPKLHTLKAPAWLGAVEQETF